MTVIASSFNHAASTQIACTTKGQLSSLTRFGDVPFLFLYVPAYRGRVDRLWNMLIFALKVWNCVGTRHLQKPEIVIGSSLTLPAAFAASRLAHRLGVPFVLEIRDLWPQTLIDMGMSPWHPAVVGFGVIERFLYRNSTKIITLLPNATELIVSRGGRSQDIVWIPNGVDMSLIPWSDSPPHDVFTVMYAGSHGLSDALDPVLDAATILNRQSPGRFRFRLLGSGPAKDALRRRVHAEEIANVVFEDPVSKLEIFSKMQEADAFIISMKKTGLYRYGISPNKLHEYMAAGRPTIVAGSVQNNPVADSSAGITVPPEDPNAIAAAVETLAAMTLAERRDMGIRGRRYVEQHHSFSILGYRLEEVLQSALSSSELARNEQPKK